MPEISELLPGGIARYIDISCVQAQHDRSDIERLASVAASLDFVSAHVLPHWVPELRIMLEGSNTLVGSPVAFPSGGASTSTKIAETRWLLDAGVQELDVVVNVARLRSGETQYVTDELAEVVTVVDGALPLRAILEVGYLEESQIRAGVRAAIDAGVRWVKTATGWSGVPTTLEHVRIIAEENAGRASLKAAGGVRDIPTMTAMARLGVTRFGMNIVAAQVAVEQEATS